MSQEPSWQDRLSAAQSAISLFIESVSELLEVEVDDDDLDEDDIENLEMLSHSIQKLPDKVKELQAKFSAHMVNPKKKRAKLGQDGALGSDSHSESLYNEAIKFTLTLDEFMKALGSKKKAEDAIINGFYDAIAKIDFTPAQLSERIEVFMEDVSLSTIAQVIQSVRVGSGSRNMRTNYDAMTNGLLASTGPVEWLQQIGIKAHALAFIVGFNQNKSQKEKSLAIERMYLGTENGKMTTNMRKSAGYKQFKAQLRNNVRGANRLLSGYKAIGSIIVLHPDLDFRHFVSAHIGADTQALVTFLHKKIRGSSRLKDMEASRRELLWAALSVMASEDLKTELQAVFASADAASVPED